MSLSLGCWEVCDLCGNPIGNSVKEVSEHLAAIHKIGSSCSKVLAINLFTSTQARNEVMVILEDLEMKRKSVEKMTIRMEEAEKHTSMLMFLNDNVNLQYEEEKKKNYKLIQLLSIKEEEIRCYKYMLEKKEGREQNNNQRIVDHSHGPGPAQDQSMLNEIIDIKLELVNCRNLKGKQESEGSSLQQRNHSLEENIHSLKELLRQKDLELRELQEIKSNLEKELKLKDEKEEKILLKSKEREEEVMLELIESKQMLIDKDEIIQELAISLEVQKEENEKKKIKNAKEKEMKKKHEKEKKALEAQIVAKEKEISEWKIKFHRFQRSIRAKYERTVETIYDDLYLIIFLLYIFLLGFASLI